MYKQPELIQGLHTPAQNFVPIFDQASHAISQLQSSWRVSQLKSLAFTVLESSDLKTCRQDNSLGDWFLQPLYIQTEEQRGAKAVMMIRDSCMSPSNDYSEVQNWALNCRGVAPTWAALAGFWSLERNGVEKFSLF